MDFVARVTSAPGWGAAGLAGAGGREARGRAFGGMGPAVGAYVWLLAPHELHYTEVATKGAT